MLHELDLDLVGLLERFLAFAQRPFHVHGVGHVLEGDQRGAVGQRYRGQIDDVAVAPLDPAAHRRAVVDRRDGRVQRMPERVIAGQRLAPADHGLDIGGARQGSPSRAATCAQRPD